MNLLNKGDHFKFDHPKYPNSSRVGLVYRTDTSNYDKTSPFGGRGMKCTTFDTKYCFKLVGCGEPITVTVNGKKYHCTQKTNDIDICDNNYNLVAVLFDSTTPPKNDKVCCNRFTLLVDRLLESGGNQLFGYLV